MALLNIDRNLYPEPISVEYTGDKTIINGSFVAYKQGKKKGYQEVYEATDLEDKAKMLAFICEPFHPYRDTDTEDEMKFKKGDILRAEPFKTGIEITISKKDCIEGEVKDGDCLKVKAKDVKLTKDAEGTSAVATVIKTYKFNGQDSVRIRFI